MKIIIIFTFGILGFIFGYNLRKYETKKISTLKFTLITITCLLIWIILMAIQIYNFNLEKLVELGIDTLVEKI